MFNLKNLWRQSLIRKSFQVLSKSDRKKLSLVVLLQVFLSVIDLVGVLSIGILGALSVTGLSSKKPNDLIISVLRLLQIENLPFEQQVSLMGLVSISLLVGRTFLSILFTRKVLFFLSRRGANISSKLIARILAQPLLSLQARSTQETLFAVTNGVGIITLQIIATFIILISDISLLVILIIGLLLVDFTTAIATTAIFVFVGIGLYRFMHLRASFLGKNNSILVIKSNEKIIEVFDSYRESVVRNRRDYYAREIGRLRFQLADATAEQNFMPYISKYVIETTVILGALLISATTFILFDVTKAVSTLAIFIAAGTRIAPAVLRVQQGSIVIKGALASALPTLDLIESLGNVDLPINANDLVDIKHEGFVPQILIKDLSFTYPGQVAPAISNISLAIKPGNVIAFVGPSGSGKSTLVDIILGVFKPDTGEVFISGLNPNEAISSWPGAIGYVPQNVMVAAGTISENISLGFPEEVADKELITKALLMAKLKNFVDELPLGVDTQVGERGTKLSGGQRQRLGIARALFTQPRLLVLDEATSALDAETEASVSEAVLDLKGETTILIVAHRLSTVRLADAIVYLDAGKILSVGTFEHVRSAVPDFNRQATLMGL